LCMRVETVVPLYDAAPVLRVLMNSTVVVTAALFGALVIWGAVELTILFWPRKPSGK
jgi:hypothetical protein